MSAAQRQEVAASAAGAVEQAVLRSLGVLDEQARAMARQASAEDPSRSTGDYFHHDDHKQTGGMLLESCGKWLEVVKMLAANSCKRLLAQQRAVAAQTSGYVHAQAQEGLHSAHEFYYQA